MGVGHPCFVLCKVFKKSKSLYLFRYIWSSIWVIQSLLASSISIYSQALFIYLFSYPWIFLAIFWIIHISLYKKEKNPEWEWDSCFICFSLVFSLLLVRVFGFWSSEYLFIFIRRKILFDFTVVKFGLCTNSNSVAYRVKWLGWFFHARIRVWQRPLFWVSSPLLPWLLHPHFTVYYTSVLLCLVAEELLKGYRNWHF